MKLKNKVAIITGGAGGIGRILVSTFINEGAVVVVTDINSAQLNKIPVKTDRLIKIKADISKVKDVKLLLNKTISSFGTVDILVNAAAVQTPVGILTEVDSNDWIKTVNINLVGTMLCCKHVLPVMLSKKKGKIINFAGGGATFPRKYFSAYAVSKTAIVRFTEIIAEEVKGRGVDINAISPGSVYTGMIEDIIRAGKKAGASDLKTAVKVKNGGGVSPELAANLCVYLASDESDGITGKLISAVWDNWKGFSKNMSKIKNSSLYTLRRVDGIKIKESGLR
ncbi:MAG: SDR family oxidoreductase [Elusimicrobiota bacterium]